MRPPVPETVRQADKDDVIPLSEPIKLKDGTETDSLVLKKGAYLFLPIHAINRKYIEDMMGSL